jgi:hypothetical protein
MAEHPEVPMPDVDALAAAVEASALKEMMTQVERCSRLPYLWIIGYQPQCSHTP